MAVSFQPFRALLQEYPQLIILSIACSSFLLFYLYYKIFVYLCRRSGHMIPVIWPIIGMFPSVAANCNHLHNYVCDALGAAGSTFNFKGPWLLGMDFILTCDPANVHHVFTANFSNYPKGDEFGEIFNLLGGGLFSADGDSWRTQRKMAHAAIGGSTFRSFMATTTRDKAERGLIPFLRRVAESGNVVDIDDIFSRAVFDITCNIVFGADPGSLSITFPAVPFANAMDDFWEASLFRHAVPASWWKFARWLGVGPERKMAKASKVIDQFMAHELSRKREERGKATSDTVDFKPPAAADLLSHYMYQSFHEVNDFFESEEKYLRDTTLFLLIAGRDAFSITISWFFFLLSKNPAVEAKILDELRAHADPSISTVVFDAEQLGKMVYLHGAICETLRLYAPVPFEHKCAVSPDVLPSGHRVGAGTKVLFSVYAMGRMEGIWGKDCLEFRPERWVTESGRTKHVAANKFMVFNSGPRSCLGKEVGLMQLKTMAAAVLWNFVVEVVDGQVGEPKNSSMLRMRNGLKAKIRKRVW